MIFDNVKPFCFCLILALSVSVLAFATLSVAQENASDGANEIAKPNVVIAGPFRIHVHCDDASVVKTVKQIGEQTWDIASKAYGADMPDEELDVHLYRNIEGYLTADEELTGGKFKMNQAFAHFKTLSAHVAIQPPISDELLAAIGLPKQSARLLAHEMAHLVRFKRMPNTFRNHPYWLIDGMASHVDQQVLAAVGYMDEPMGDPNFGTYASQTRQLLGEGKLPTVEQLLDDDKLEIGFYRRYSVRWVFVNMLAMKHGPKFDEFLRDLRRVGGGRGYAGRAKDLLLEHLDVDVETLDNQFREHLQGMAPRWVEQGRLMETHGEVWDQIAFPKSTATCWRQEPLADSFTVSKTATVHDVGLKQFNVRIGKPDAFTQFSITAGFGLNVFEFADKEWETKLGKEHDGIEIGKPVELVIEHDHDANETVVKIDGKTVFKGELNIATDSQIGLGAQKGSAISWQGLDVK